MTRTSYVRESADGAWEVVREGHRRATAVADTRAKAVARARTLLEQQGGGEIRIMNRVGKMIDSTKVARPTARTAKS